MKKVKIDHEGAKLREKAEKFLKRNSKKNAKPIAESEVLKLVHELQVHQIEIELQNEELIEAKKAAQIATEKYAELYDFALFGFFTLSKEGEILALNIAGAKMLGNKHSELINRRFVLFTSDESKPIFNSFCEKIISSKVKQSCEVKILNNSSSHAHVHLSGIISEDENQFFVMALDITSRKHTEIEIKRAKEKAEESEQKYIALYENAPLPYQSLNEDGSFKDVNPAWLSTLGYQREEVIGKFYKDFLHPEWQGHFEKNFPAFKKRGYVSDVQFKIRHKKGHFIDISFEGCIGYHPDGSFKQTYCVFQDITYKKQVESELIDAKEKAEESELKFRNAFNSAGIGMCLVSLDGKFLELNKSALGIWGYKESELLDMTFQQITHPDDLDKGLELLNETIEGKISNYSIVKRYYNKKGDIIFANLNVSIVRNLKNEPQFFVAQIEDITKEIRFEQELIKSKKIAEENEAKFRELFSNVNDALFIFNPDTFEILEANNATSELYGYSYDELIGMSCLKFSAELEKSKSVAKLIKNEKKVTVKLRHHKKKDGTDVFVELNTHNISVNGKNIFYSVCHDITDIKKTEQELLKNQYYLNKAQALGNIGTWELDLLSNRLVWTDETYKIFGIPTGTPLTYELFLNCIHPEDRDYVAERWNEALKNKSYDIEHRILVQGEIKWLREKSEFEYDSNGNAIRAIGFAQDITNQKNSEQELSISEQKYRNIAENLPGIVLRYKLNTDGSDELLYISKGVEDLYELSPEDALKNNNLIWDRVHKDDLDAYLSSVEESAKNLSFWKFEHRIQLPDSRIKWVYMSGVPGQQEDGSVIWDSIGLDITERMNAEEELKKIEWLLEKEKEDSGEENKNYIPDYGDVTKLNTERTILDNVGADTLKILCADIMDLLDTSIAIYEKNGDYAYGQFDSTWCQAMDKASFLLCKTQDNKEALKCGNWLCHENCWNDSAKEAINSQKTTDIECVGGIHLFAVPIYAGKKLIGCINMGYGNPPSDEKNLKVLAEKFKVNYDVLAENANQYKARPPFIIENAKKRLRTVAQLIGEIVESARKEKEIIKAKEKAEESEQRLKLASSSGELGIWDWNLNDNSMIWNERMFELYGINQNTFSNNVDAWVNGLHPEDKDRAIAESNEALAGGKEFDTTFRVLHPNGTVKYLKADAVVIRDNNKKAIRMIGINKDVTESILAEQLLKKSEANLKEINATKDKLFSIIAHDLRSPFNNILGFSELLSENVKESNIEESTRYADIINSAAQNSLSLLDNLLNWAKSQTGNLGITSEKITLSKVILEVIQLKKLLAKSKNITLNYTPSDEFEVYSDENMLRLVLRNLISNAIKFTKPGGNINISVISVQNHVEISVSDNGVGMSDETCKKLFDISTNTTSPGTANEKGSGLGLVLCKEFVEKLGGNIWVESEEGVGSTFYFTLEYNSGAESKPVIDNDRHILKEDNINGNLKILIVEDDGTSKDLISIMVKKFAKKIIYAGTGSEAVKICRNHPDIDLILMDIRLPDMNGYEATRQIRQFNKDVVILAQTAYALAGDKEKAIEAGCNDYIPKPINKDRLLEIIATHLQHKNS